MISRLSLVILFGVFLTACVSPQQYEKLRNDFEHQAKVLQDLQGNYEVLEARNAELEGDLANMNLELEKYRQNSDTARTEIERLQGELATAVSAAREQKNPWEIVPSPGEGAFSYRILDTLLFPKGSAEISDSGRDIVKRLSKELMKHDFEIQVEGHTDIDPVVVHEKEFPLGNPQLAAFRALNVLAELRKNGVPERRLSMAAYGPNRPTRAGTSEEDKRLNRRVDVKVFVHKKTEGG
ncbi:MAG: OmpA family protein [Planctomycetota bacterium]